MKYYLQCVWIVAAVGLLASCQSVKKQRISAHQETWSKLLEEDRHRLMQGQLRVGDTEEMVRIALGPPDKVIPMSGADGQKQTLWLYDVLDVYSDPYHPNSPTSFADHSQDVVFQNGSMIDRWGTDDRGIPARVSKSRVEVTVENMLTRLDVLVNLTPEQKVNAHDIFLKASEALDHFSWDERGPKGVPIRKKMREDIRGILTAEQRAKYDAAPQRLGGGSAKRR